MSANSITSVGSNQRNVRRLHLYYTIEIVMNKQNIKVFTSYLLDCVNLPWKYFNS